MSDEELWAALFNDPAAPPAEVGANAQPASSPSMSDDELPDYEESDDENGGEGEEGDSESEEEEEDDDDEWEDHVGSSMASVPFRPVDCECWLHNSGGCGWPGQLCGARRGAGGRGLVRAGHGMR
jgi:hypothetical protein